MCKCILLIWLITLNDLWIIKYKETRPEILWITMLLWWQTFLNFCKILNDILKY